MKLKITKKWMDKLSSIKDATIYTIPYDFIYRYNKVVGKDIQTTIYQCNYGDEMEINQNDYNNNYDLKQFTKQGYLEIT